MKTYWWAYVHSSNNSIQLKRWFGDRKDYTEDCQDNPFVLKIVEPFEANTREEAMKIVLDKLAASKE